VFTAANLYFLVYERTRVCCPCPHAWLSAPSRLCRFEA